MPANLTTRILAIQKLIGAAQTGVFDINTCIELQRRGNITVSSTNLTVHIKSIQRMVNTVADGIIGPATITRIEAFINPAFPVIPGGGSLVVSTRSLDMIIGFEISSKQVYEKKYQQPLWPGEESGITIGIGFDCGYCTADEFKQAWKDCITQQELDLLLTIIGKRGETAKTILSTVKAVKIPYAIASKVFYQSTLPAYAKLTAVTYPGTEKLPPDAQGALLSLVYNRGGNLDPKKDSRKEMRDIVPLVAAADLAGIANQIRSMKRLWPKAKGLRDRRDQEADLVENAGFDILPEAQVVV